MYLFDGRSISLEINLQNTRLHFWSEKVCYVAKMYAINVCLLLTHSHIYVSVCEHKKLTLFTADKGLLLGRTAFLKQEKQP